jgi:Mg2+ and Co2+ transporter CorA
MARRLVKARTGTDAFERMTRAIEAEMEKIADELLRAAERDAPVESAEEHEEHHPGQPHLKDTGFARVTRRPNRIEGIVGFRAFYAAWQEERRDYKHTRGKAGYLGDNVKLLLPSYRRRLADAARAAIEGG